MKKLPWERDGQDIAAFFKSKTPEELDIIEHGGETYYPERLHRKSPKDGQTEYVKLRVRAVGTLDKTRARLQALIWARDLGIAEGYFPAGKAPAKLTIKEAEEIFGGFYFDWLDTLCIISQVAVEYDQPGEPFFRPEMLAKNYTDASLAALYDAICHHTNYEDVRADEFDEESFIGTLAAIDEARDVRPLLALSGGCRDRFVTTMASRLLSFLRPKPSSPSTGKSTASPPPN
jgi:hypothetical protein